MHFDRESFLTAINANIQLTSQRNNSINKIKFPYNDLIVKLENVDTVYEGERIPTLHKVSMQVSKGELIFIVGPNGAGKTTILETICGILPISKGEVMVFGLSVKQEGPDIRKRIGYVIQGLEFEPNEPFLVKDVVMIGRSGLIGLGKRIKEADWEIVRASLQAVGMEDFWSRPIGKLSAGQHQKVMLANALSGEPELLLLDEPFANLDINARQEIYQLLLKLNQEAGVTILCVSHGSDIPKEVNRVVMLRQGKLVLDSNRITAVESKIYRAFVELSASEA